MATRIVDAPNTHNPALIALREKGYVLGIYPPDEPDHGEGPRTEIGHWFARSGDREFVAGDPLALLGLAALWEHRGDNWRRVGDPDIDDEIVAAAYPDE